jgi:hypothetical protein
MVSRLTSAIFCPPFISHSTVVPSSLRQTMSDFPSLLSSPIAATCQSLGSKLIAGRRRVDQELRSDLRHRQHCGISSAMAGRAQLHGAEIC